MAEPTGAKTSASGARTYFDPVTGRRLPSVTTILGVLNKPNLYQWYAKMAGERAVKEFKELQERLADAKNAKEREEVRLWVSAAAREYTAARALRGTELHDLAEKSIKGEPLPKLEKDAQRLLNGYLKFVEEQKPTFHHTELTIINRTYQYAGTGDFIASLWSTFGVPVVGDWKTSATGPYDEWALQLVAYMRGEATLIKEGSLIKAGPMPEVAQDRALIVKIKPDDYEMYEPVLDFKALWQMFIAARRLWVLTRQEEVFRRV